MTTPLLPPRLRVFLILVAAVGILGVAFHTLGFFGAPINLVYSDVLGFYERASAPGFAYVSKPIEYPVLTGLFIEGAARLGGSRAGYYAVSVLALLGFAVATTWLLYKAVEAEERGEPRLPAGRQGKMRMWRYWIFAPSMFFFATYNWDLIAVFLSVAALHAAYKKRNGWAAFFLALGFVAKFYPALYLIPLLLVVPSWKERGKTLAIFCATALAVNLPFMLLNFGGWSYFFTLNSVRNSNPDSIWTIARFFFRGLDVAGINALSLTLFVGAYAWVMARFRKAPMLQLCFAATLLFLITNKIFSPQYVLWLLPFFVLLPATRSWQFYLLEGANLATFFAILPWFFFGHDMFYFYLASPFVMLRHAALIGITIAAYRTMSRAHGNPSVTLHGTYPATKTTY